MVTQFVRQSAYFFISPDIRTTRAIHGNEGDGHYLYIKFDSGQWDEEYDTLNPSFEVAKNDSGLMPEFYGPNYPELRQFLDNNVMKTLNLVLSDGNWYKIPLNGRNIEQLEADLFHTSQPFANVDLGYQSALEAGGNTEAGRLAAGTALNGLKDGTLSKLAPYKR
ncbi:hypothetical protein RhiLY_12822 [Ceratobasidium sp. AG-Ba]|nr:hypothetical protein RhiLY_12822 [Ceratobasidium sp. AG-Ba]